MIMSSRRLQAAMLVLGLSLLSGNLLADGDDGISAWIRSWLTPPQSGVAPTDLKLYEQECGSCHFPYQPGLLPALSWKQIITSLDDHFSENVSLEQGERIKIQNFLLDNSAGQINFGLPNKIMASQQDYPLPIRVTETQYFLHEHSEIPPRMVSGNSKVGSIGNCDHCHQRARRGLYDEHDVLIPGYVRDRDYDD